VKVTIAAGAEVDLATPTEVERIVSASLRQYFKVPNKQKRRGSVLIPTPTATSIIDLGGPVAGRVWEIRNVVVSGVDPTTAYTGKAVIVIGEAGVNVSGGAVDALSVVGFIGTLPGNIQYSSDQAVVLNNEHLYVMVNGAVQATMAVAAAQVVDVPMWEEETQTV